MMGSYQHHVFVSYARADNPPRGGLRTGWVDAFVEELQSYHEARTGRPLDVFFDKTGIANGAEWETRIQQELRRSRLFIAILSENWLRSEICRREFEDYVRHEQSVMPGGSGVRPIYFATIELLEKGGGPPPPGLDWLIAELQARNRDPQLDLRDWAKEGAQALAEMDAAERLAALHAAPQPTMSALLNGIETLSLAIGGRLNDASLWELARGLGNLPASYINFVGRAREIAEIHRNLVDNQLQVVTALHGLGGQGKSALARQYGHAFASHYAAGGRWEIACEGLGRDLPDSEGPLAALALAFDQLADVIASRGPGNGHPDQARFAALTLTQKERDLPADLRLGRHLARLRAFTVDGWPDRLAALRDGVQNPHGDWRTTHDPRMLVILENVDTPRILNERALAALQAPEWLELIVTTRLPPDSLGSRDGLTTLRVDSLPKEDALALLRAFRPLVDEAEVQAAREIVMRLDGYTLAVELAGAFLNTNPSITISAYLERLDTEGVTGLDQAANEDVKAKIRHSDRQIGVILAQTLAGLSEIDRDILFVAAHFPPDAIMADWLRAILAERHETSFAPPPPGYPDPWTEALKRLSGRQLLTPVVTSDQGGPQFLSMHRVIGDWLREIDRDRTAGNRNAVTHLLELLGSRMDDDQRGWRIDPSIAALGPPLADLSKALLVHGVDARVIRPLGVAAYIEGTTRSLSLALELQRECVLTAERLLAQDPTSAQAARDLSWSQGRLGDFFLRRGQTGDAERALSMFQAALETNERLFEANPDSAQAARDVVACLQRLGNLARRQGSADKASEHFTSLVALLDDLVGRGFALDAEMTAAHAHYRDVLRIRRARILRLLSRCWMILWGWGARWMRK